MTSKIIRSLMLVALTVVTSCLLFGCSEGYDDSELSGKADEIASRIEKAKKDIERINSDLIIYKDMVETMAGFRSIVSVTETGGTITVLYSDGVSYSFASGKDGSATATVTMPILSLDESGYWQISTDGGKTWTRVTDVNGNPVSGVSSEPDASEVPVIGIDEEGYWTVDYGDGPQYVLDENGEKVPAQTASLPSSYFLSAALSEDGCYIEIEIISGDVLKIPVASAFVFRCETASPIVFSSGETKRLPLEQQGTQSIAIERPEGWKVTVSETEIVVTAPQVDSQGTIAFYVTSQASLLKIIELEVESKGVSAPVTGTVELDKLYGYAEGTTGGEGATAANIHHFNDGAKFQTWLQAREKAKSTVPAIVWLSGTFHKDDGRAASSPWFDIKRTSNITIYGTDDFVMENIGFFLNEANNIIIRNVYIKMPKADNGADGISMQESSNVWVDHCTFESVNQTHDYEDGSCDVTHQSHNVTVSWCHFIKTQKSCLVGHSNSQTADASITVTFHHNFFDLSNSRHPRVRFGKAHVYNNFFNQCSTYGVGSAYGAMVLVENNLFDGVRLPTDICTFPAKPSGSSWVSNLQGSVAGYLYERGNVFLNRPTDATDPYPFTNVEYKAYNGAKLPEPLVYEDFKPTYEYVVDAAEDISAIVPASSGVGKLQGYASAPIEVDNGGLGTTEPDPDPNPGPDPDVPTVTELGNGWSFIASEGASSTAAASVADGRLTMTSCGKFESGAQNFGYAYREVTGDFVITAAVVSYSPAKAASNQAIAGLLVTPDATKSATDLVYAAAGYNTNGYRLSRVAAGTNRASGTLKVPASDTGNAVLKMERVGQKVSVSYSLDGGQTFGSESSVTFTDLPDAVSVGLAVNSGDNKATATAVFSDVIINDEPVEFL